jgi:hypothetical protein
MRALPLSTHPLLLQSLLLAPRTISPSEHHWAPLLSVVVLPSLQLRLQVASMVRTPVTSSLSLSPSPSPSLSLSLSLSLNYHDNLPSPRTVMPPHGHESTMYRELAMVPSSIDQIHDFSIQKQFHEIPDNTKIAWKPLNFFNKFRYSSYLFKNSP